MDRRWATRLFGLLLAAGLVTGLAAGCSDSSRAGESLTGTVGAADAPAAVPNRAEAVKPDAAGQPAQPQDAPRQEQIGQPGVDRTLVRTATLELGTPNPVEVTDRARDIATELGGFAGQEEVRGESATLTLHIPSDRFDGALRRLSGLVEPGNVLARTQTAEDVTEQLVDLDSRIATQRGSVERVRALLARAQTVGEIVQIEGEVTRREADLESLQKRRERLAGQVALSTVTVRASKGAPVVAEDDDGGGFLAGLTAGWHAFRTTGGVLLRVLGALLPFLIVLGVPGLFALRWWRRRRQLAPAADPAPAP